MERDDEEEVIWIKREKDICAPETTANKLNPPDVDTQKRDPPLSVLSTSEKIEDGNVEIREASPSPTPAQPFDVIAIDVTGQPLSDNILPSVEKNHDDMENPQVIMVSGSGVSENSRLPYALSCVPEHEIEDVVWNSQATSDIQAPDITTNEQRKPDTKIHEQVLSVLTINQSDNGQSDISKPSSSPPPLPIDIVAVDITRQPLSENVEEDQRCNVDDEYCHSPLGGAMPESEDSSVADFVFP